jgi:hypothetical protein
MLPLSLEVSQGQLDYSELESLSPPSLDSSQHNSLGKSLSPPSLQHNSLGKSSMPALSLFKITYRFFHLFQNLFTLGKLSKSAALIKGERLLPFSIFLIASSSLFSPVTSRFFKADENLKW